MSQKSDKHNDKDAIKSNKIKELINEKRFAMLQSAAIVVQLKVSKTLIEGTTDEYYNKLSIMDTLTISKVKAFQNTLQDDETYDWEAPINELSFDPEQQFLLKGKDGQLTVLLDSKSKLVGFIDLNGQELIAIKNTIYFK
jgi:hypothetical protein